MQFYVVQLCYNSIFLTHSFLKSHCLITIISNLCFPKFLRFLVLPGHHFQHGNHAAWCELANIQRPSSSGLLLCILPVFRFLTLRVLAVLICWYLQTAAFNAFKPSFLWFLAERLFQYRVMFDSQRFKKTKPYHM